MLFCKLPVHCLRDGSPIAGGPEGYVFCVLINRMARKSGRVIYKNEFVDLEEGEVCCSIRDLAKVTGYSAKVIRTALKNLQKWSILAPLEGSRTPYNTTKYFIDLSVFGHTNGHNEGQARGTRGAHEGHTDRDTKTLREDSPSESAVADQPQKPDSPVVHLDAEFYRLGRKVLGENQGGQLTKLKDLFGIGQAFDLLSQAQHKDRPAEWIAGTINRSNHEQQTGDRFAKPKKRARGQSW
jgi:hypothetical protein